MMACQKTSSGYNSNNSGPAPSGGGTHIEQAIVFEKEFPDQLWSPSGYYYAGANELGYILLTIPELSTIPYYYLSIQQKTTGGSWEELFLAPDVMSALYAYALQSLRANFFIDEAWQNGRIRIYNPFRRMSPITIRVRAIR